MNSKFLKLALCLGLFAGAMNNDGWSMNSKEISSNINTKQSIGSTNSYNMTHDVKKSTNQSNSIKISEKKQTSKSNARIDFMKKRLQERSKPVTENIDKEKELYKKFERSKFEDYENSIAQLTKGKISIDYLTKNNQDLEAQINKIAQCEMTQKEMKSFSEKMEKYKQISEQAQEVSNKFSDAYEAYISSHEKNKITLKDNTKTIDSYQKQINDLTKQIVLLEAENEYISKMKSEFEATEVDAINKLEQYLNIRGRLANNILLARKALNSNNTQIASQTSAVNKIYQGFEKEMSVIDPEENLQNNLSEVNNNMTCGNIISEQQVENEEVEIADDGNYNNNNIDNNSNEEYNNEQTPKEYDDEEQIPEE
jgi:chromosome segregation ATPase